jgi:ribonuclease P/MRP protein subunit RPP1
MELTDACVYPYPAGDASVRRMAFNAGELGFDAIVAIGESCSGEYAGVRILQGAVVREPAIKDVINAVKRAQQRADVVFVCSGDVSFTRTLSTLPGVGVITGVHLDRRRGFDHVAAKSAADKGIGVEITLSPLIQWRGHSRQRVLQNYADILRLQRRYHFPLVIGSGAGSLLEQRSIRAVYGLCGLFGMREEEVMTALGNIGRMVEAKGPVEVIS